MSRLDLDPFTEARCPCLVGREELTHTADGRAAKGGHLPSSTNKPCQHGPTALGWLPAPPRLWEALSCGQAQGSQTVLKAQRLAHHKAGDGQASPLGLASP